MKITKEAFKKALDKLIGKLSDRDFIDEMPPFYRPIVKKNYLPIVIYYFSQLRDNFDSCREKYIKKAKEYISNNFKETEEAKKVLTIYLDPTETVEHFCDVWFEKLLCNDNFDNFLDDYLKTVGDVGWRNGNFIDVNFVFAACKELNASASEIYDFMTELYYEEGHLFSLLGLLNKNIEEEVGQYSHRHIKIVSFLLHNKKEIVKNFFKKLLPYIYAIGHRYFCSSYYNLKELCYKSKLEFPDAVDGLSEEEIKEYLHV